MPTRSKETKLQLVGKAPARSEGGPPDVISEAIWTMTGLRGEPGQLGRSDGLPVIERRNAKAQTVSLSALEAIVSELSERDSLTIRLSMTAAKNGVLEAIIAAHGSSMQTANERRDAFNKGLAAVFKAALPHVDMAESAAPVGEKLAHRAVLMPHGTRVPLLSTAGKGGTLQRNRTVLELPPVLSIGDLQHLSSQLEALMCDVTVELSITPVDLDDAQLELVESALDAVRARRAVDVQEFYHREELSGVAITQLGRLLIDQRGLKLTATVGSSRALSALELSLVSSAIFGAPHRPRRAGRYAELAHIHVTDTAVLTLLGFTLAAVGPCQERRDVSELANLNGLAIGKSSSGHLVRMCVEDPRSHTYTIGRSGAGKSTLIINMALQDIVEGRAVIVVDPHGDLCDDIYARIPKNRLKDVVYYHCADPHAFPLINPMERRPDADPALETSRVVDGVKRMIRRVLYPGYDPDAFGPMYDDLIQAALYLLIEGCEDDARVTDVERVVTDRSWRRELLRRPGVSEETKRKWKKFEDVDENWHKLENLTPYVTSKVAVFTQNQLIRPILDGRDLDAAAVAKHQLDFEKILRDKKIVLINLAVTQVGETASTLLGGLVTMKLYEAAKRQPRDARNQRPSAAVYLDEFQTYATEILADMMAETRKFGLRITLANQTLGQLRARGRDHLHAILGNASNLVLFGVDTEDAVYLSQRFPGMLMPSELASLPNYEAVCRFQTKSKAYGPLRIRTLPAPDVLRSPPERDL